MGKTILGITDFADKMNYTF